MDITPSLAPSLYPTKYSSHLFFHRLDHHTPFFFFPSSIPIHIPQSTSQAKGLAFSDRPTEPVSTSLREPGGLAASTTTVGQPLRPLLALQPGSSWLWSRLRSPTVVTARRAMWPPTRAARAGPQRALRSRRCRVVTFSVEDGGGTKSPAPTRPAPLQAAKILLGAKQVCHATVSGKLNGLSPFTVSPSPSLFLPRHANAPPDP